MKRTTANLSRRVIGMGLAAAFLVIVAAGFLAPIGSYTTKNECLADETSHVLKHRLTLIKGETLSKAKAAGTAGCVLPTKYTLYIL